MQRAKFAWPLPGAIRLTLQINYGIINQIYIRNVKEMNWKRRTIFIILTLIMLVALGCAIFFVACDKEVSDAGEAPDGSVCPDFTVQIYDNATGELTERTYSPSDSRGKVTVINFWGTWCPYCIMELPDFDQVAREDPDVTIVAVHSISSKEEAPAYISANYADSNIVFTQDSVQAADGARQDVCTLLGGRGSYPRTIILDSEGVITFEKTGMISAQALAEAIAQAKG